MQVLVVAACSTKGIGNQKSLSTYIVTVTLQLRIQARGQGEGSRDLTEPQNELTIVLRVYYTCKAKSW